MVLRIVQQIFHGAGTGRDGQGNNGYKAYMANILKKRGLGKLTDMPVKLGFRGITVIRVNPNNPPILLCK